MSKFYRFLVAGFFILFAFTNRGFGENLIRNPGFEEGDTYIGWSGMAYVPDKALFKIKKGDAHTGNNCLVIENKAKNDSRLIQSVPVKPDTNYKVSGWIKTENVAVEGGGANISLTDSFNSSHPVTGTNGKWELVEFYFTTEKGADKVNIGPRIGNFGGDCTGKAFFDDIIVEETKTIPSGGLRFIIQNQANGQPEQSQSQPREENKSVNIGSDNVSGIIITIVLVVLAGAIFSINFFIKKKIQEAPNE